VEKFFLDAGLILEEMYVVYEQNVGPSILVFEFVGGPVVNGLNELIRKVFCSNADYFHGWISFCYGVAYGMHEVSLTQANAAIDEKGIVDSGWGLGDCF
jgi:hypothetical protein